MTTENRERIKVEFGPITVDSVGEGLNEQKHRAQLRQVVTKTYPSAGTHDSLTDPLFSAEEFNLKEGNQYQENRVTWIDIPKGATIEQVVEKLANHPNARLVKHLSLYPILTVEQQSAIQSGLTGQNGERITVDSIGAKQAVRDSDENITNYKGYLQFRVIKFSTSGVADIDTREKDYEKMVTEGVAKPFEMANSTTILAKIAGDIVNQQAI